MSSAPFAKLLKLNLALHLFLVFVRVVIRPTAYRAAKANQSVGCLYLCHMPILYECSEFVKSMQIPPAFSQAEIIELQRHAFYNLDELKACPACPQKLFGVYL